MAASTPESRGTGAGALIREAGGPRRGGRRVAIKRANAL